ncbi:hypothetical protein PT2222_90084 [Paraburkholderia tropica]
MTASSREARAAPSPTNLAQTQRARFAGHGAIGQRRSRYPRRGVLSVDDHSIIATLAAPPQRCCACAPRKNPRFLPKMWGKCAPHRRTARGRSRRSGTGSGRRTELQPDDAEHDQRRTRHARGAHGLAHHHDAEHERAHRADARPHGVGRAERQLTHGDREQHETAERGHDREHGGPETRETFGGLETGRPGDFEQASNEKNEPGHPGRST